MNRYKEHEEQWAPLGYRAVNVALQEPPALNEDQMVRVIPRTPDGVPRKRVVLLHVAGPVGNHTEVDGQFFREGRVCL